MHGIRQSISHHSRQFFVRGLAILLPSVLTVWLLLAGYQFVQSRIAEPVNAGIRELILHGSPWPRVSPAEVAEHRDRVQSEPGRAWGRVVLDNRQFERDARRAKLHRWWRTWAVPMDMVGLVVAVVGIYAAGVVLGSYIGRRLYTRGEALIGQIPLVGRVYLKGYFTGRFGLEFRIDQIKPEHASDWLAAFARGDLDKHREGKRQVQHGEKAPATVCGQARLARTIFNSAVKENIIGRNPFTHLNQQPPRPDQDWQFITREAFDKLLEACESRSSRWKTRQPDADVFWKAALGLARLGGLRRSEIAGVKLANVDLHGAGDKGLAGVTVYGRKTARKTAVPYRFVPIPDQLQGLLADAINALVPGEAHVVSRRYIKGPDSLSAGLAAIFKRAGLNGGKPWPEFYQCCRRSRATELAEAGVPLASHCEVLGHTADVAQRYYLKTRSNVLAQIADI